MSVITYEPLFRNLRALGHTGREYALQRYMPPSLLCTVVWEQEATTAELRTLCDITNMPLHNIAEHSQQPPEINIAERLGPPLNIARLDEALQTKMSEHPKGSPRYMELDAVRLDTLRRAQELNLIGTAPEDAPQDSYHTYISIMSYFLRAGLEASEIFYVDDLTGLIGNHIANLFDETPDLKSLLYESINIAPNDSTEDEETEPFEETILTLLDLQRKLIKVIKHMVAANDHYTLWPALTTARVEINKRYNAKLKEAKNDV